MSFHLTRTLLLHRSFGTMVQPLLQEYIQATQQEPACLSLRLYQHRTDAHLCLLSGQWRNEIAYLWHLDQPHYRHFFHLAASMLVEPSGYYAFLPITDEAT